MESGSNNKKIKKKTGTIIFDYNHFDYNETALRNCVFYIFVVIRNDKYSEYKI